MTVRLRFRIDVVVAIRVEAYYRTGSSTPEIDHPTFLHCARCKGRWLGRIDLRGKKPHRRDMPRRSSFSLSRKCLTSPGWTSRQPCSSTRSTGAASIRADISPGRQEPFRPILMPVLATSRMSSAGLARSPKRRVGPIAGATFFVLADVAKARSDIMRHNGCPFEEITNDQKS
jgi:hypothetical protein